MQAAGLFCVNMGHGRDDIATAGGTLSLPVLAQARHSSAYPRSSNC